MRPMYPGGGGGAPGGVWDGMPVADAGFAGNPLLMGGLQALAAASRGDEWAGPMGRGMQGAYGAQNAAQTQQLRQLQMSQTLRAQQRQEQQQDALRRAVGGPKMRETFGDELVTAAQGSDAVAQALFAAQARNASAPDKWTANPVTGEYYNTRTGPPGAGEGGAPGAPGKWNEMMLAREFKMADYPPGVWAEAVASGSPAPLMAHGQTGGGGLDTDAIVSMARNMNATGESLNEAVRTGDPSRLVPRDPLDVPASRTEIGSFYDDAEKSLGTYRRAGEVLQQQALTLRNPNSLSDLTSVYNFIKTLDPESVVREGEVALFDAAKSYVTRMQALVQKQENKGFLTPAERVNLAELLSGLQAISQQGYDRTRARMGRKAEVLGMPESVREAMPTATYPDPGVWSNIGQQFGAPGPGGPGGPGAGDAEADAIADRILGGGGAPGLIPDMEQVAP